MSQATTSKAPYYCKVCKDDRYDPECPTCGMPTIPADQRSKMEGSETEEPAPRISQVADRESSAGYEAADEAARSPYPLQPESDPLITSDSVTDVREVDSAGKGSQARSSPTRFTHLQQSEAEIDEYVADGFEIFLIAGVAGSGKTELLEAFKKDRSLKVVPKSEGRAIPTDPGGFESHRLADPSRRIMFADTSGEHFERLFKPAHKLSKITKQEAKYLEIVARHLRGVILMLNLKNEWGSDEGTQVTTLRNILMLLRFFANGGQHQAAGSVRDFQDQVDAQVPKLPRLRMPVLLLFSIADELYGLDFPDQSSDAWLHNGKGQGRRKLIPVGEHPLLLAHHHVPKAVTMLEDHVRTWRIDFAHSLTLDPDSGAVRSRRGCGVDLARQWLVETSARPWWTLIPTRYMLRAQSFIDRKILRRTRWSELPPANPPKRKP